MNSETNSKSLRQLLSEKSLVRAMEVHSGLTGLIVEKTVVSVGADTRYFDAMYLSSFTNSAIRAKPDIAYLDLRCRLNVISDVLDVSGKPIIFDADNGGFPEHFTLTVRTLERIGVSAVTIEDKVGLKRNSMYGVSVHQEQDRIDTFCEKISAGKQAQRGSDFMIFARIESLALGKGLQDAVRRAQAYIGAGADGIVVTSYREDPTDIFEFCEMYNEFSSHTPIAVVPTMYCTTGEEELEKVGVDLVIYANQLLRSAYPAMVKTAESILRRRCADEASQQCIAFKKILGLIPE